MSDNTESLPVVQHTEEIKEEPVADSEPTFQVISQPATPIQVQEKESAKKTPQVTMIEDDSMSPEDMEKFFKVDKLFLIMTNSGKPVYSSQGDIYQLSPIIATLYAMLSKLQTIEIPRVTTSGKLVPVSQIDQVVQQTTFKEELKQTIQNIDNNPYQEIGTKEKLKVLSSKIKMKVSQKVDELLEKRRKKKEAAEAQAQLAAIQAGQMPIGIPLSQSDNPYLAAQEEIKTTSNDEKIEEG